MKSKNKNNVFTLPKSATAITLHLSNETWEWLDSVTETSSGKAIENRKIFRELISMMQTTDENDKQFYRLAKTCKGQSQISEVALAESWGMGRKQCHNLLLNLERMGVIKLTSDRTASVVTFTCVVGWQTADGDYSFNPESPWGN
ncbi:MAG: hypothetical protein LIP02_02730 [Bacteroidales bacterium]|nr:hypothetical protein [Bacteroidales bacterium]